MSKLSEIASLYKNSPPHTEKDVEGNNFTNMILNTKQTASEALDKLAWLAGIKNAPEDDRYEKLDRSNIKSLMKSAKNLGYDIEVVTL